MTPFLAVDWGTTNRRAYRIDAVGVVEATFRDDRGVAALHREAFPAEMRAIREQLGDLPALCAGMVGSNRGWAETPYVACPVDLAGVAQGLVWVEPDRTAILPGVVDGGRIQPDVMRGEEVQLLGAVAGELAPPIALLCQPGTHCKWAWVENGHIERFATAITGELFSLLRRYSLLKAQLGADAALNDWFLAGVADAADNDLLTRLFGVRADAVSGAGRIATPSSYVSGLLIGSDVRTRVRVGDVVHVLADPGLGTLYAAAIEAAGGRAVSVDSHAAFVAGITRIWNMAS